MFSKFFMKKNVKVVNQTNFLKAILQTDFETESALEPPYSVLRISFQKIGLVHGFHNS